MKNDSKMTQKIKVFKVSSFTKHVCQIHQIWTFLIISLKNIESNLVFSHNELSVSVRVFSRGFKLREIL